MNGEDVERNSNLEQFVIDYKRNNPDHVAKIIPFQFDGRKQLAAMPLPQIGTTRQ